MPSIIETLALTKTFGTFTANDSISLSVEEGEIKAIVGENGAGKSTLMNMLYGLLHPTSGSIRIRGKEISFETPADAIASGLGMVHQHFKLVPSLSVAENVVLGIEEKYRRLPFIDTRRQIEHVQTAADRFRLNLNAKSTVADLSIGLKQRVEILKMLYRDVEILILDEPTAVLTPQEVDDLIESLHELKAQGKTIVVITHKLGEVMRMADSVSVIRRGKVVADLRTADTNERDLAALMVGRNVVLSTERTLRECARNKTVYQVQELRTTDERGREVLHDISLVVRQGEILGIAGVEGNGQSELVKVLTGLMTSTGGAVLLNGTDITHAWPGNLRRAGIGMIHEDRYIHGLCREMTVTDNIIAGYHLSTEVNNHGLLKRRAIANKCAKLVAEYDIRITDVEGPLSQLSGGNAQKVIIAREFNSIPHLLIASQPTRGVDVGSIEFIHRQILDLRDRGSAVLLVSSELSEIMSLSDRIAVMYKGQIVDQIADVDHASYAQVGLLMAGVVT